MTSFKTAALMAMLLLSLAVDADARRADRIVVFKSERTMTLQRKGETLRSYRIALGGSPVGPKQRQGDQKTPEGVYRISGRNPNSRYHRSLRISYPSGDDRKRAARLGVSPGGDIMIHGLPESWSWAGGMQSLADWTLGCIAVSNEEIDEIWELVPDGTPIEIKP